LGRHQLGWRQAGRRRHLKSSARRGPAFTLPDRAVVLILPAAIVSGDARTPVFAVNRAIGGEPLGNADDVAAESCRLDLDRLVFD
jgi:hypothetical protein